MEESNLIGYAAGATGIVSILVAFIPAVNIVAVFTAVAAIIMGMIGAGRAQDLGGPGRGMAIIGIVGGVFAILLFVIFAVFVYAQV